MVTLRNDVVVDRSVMCMDKDEFDLGATVDVDEMVDILLRTDWWTDYATTNDDDDDNGGSVVWFCSLELIVLLLENLSYGNVDTLWMFHGAECPSITNKKHVVEAML